MSRTKVILIGEIHEIKANVRAKTMTSVSVLHDYIEKKIIQYLVSQSENKTKYPSGLNIMFVNEGQDENERNNNIIRELGKLRITNQLSRIQEFSKTIMEKPSFKISYSATGLIAFLKITDVCKLVPTHRYDVQLNSSIDERYFINMFLSYKLNEFFIKEHDDCIINLIKSVFGTNNIDYDNAYIKVINKFLELIGQYNNSEYSVSELFTPLLNTTIEDRTKPFGLNETIMAELRNYRDSKLISRINVGLTRKPVDFIVFYFGLNHYDNQAQLISQSESMELDTLSLKMDKDFCDQISNPTTQLYHEVFSSLLNTMYLGR